MTGFLEGYGVEDARRSRVIRTALLAALLTIVVGSVLYFSLRAYPAKRTVNAFLTDLRNHDYQGAYRLWGCTPSSPCRDYALDKFMEDWGPKSPNANAAGFQIVKTRYCGPGVIVTLQSPQSGSVPLWYERKDGTLGFAPWPVCAPQPKAYQ